MSVTDHLSIQLYTLRSLGDLDLVLDAVAGAGFKHVETVGSQLEDAAATKAKVAARGLGVSSSHISMAALRERLAAVADACGVLGCTQIFMPAVAPEERSMDAAGWRAVGAELGRLAEKLQARGITLGYHNHDWELAKKEGRKTALDLLFEAAGSSPLAWQADVAWLVRGGVRPKTWLKRYHKRLKSAHVKDIAPKGENVDQDGWADVGSGVLDWRDLWKACRAAGAEWMVVEHDKPADPAATARNSFAYLTSTGA